MPDKFQQDGFSVVKKIYTPRELETIRRSLHTGQFERHCIWSKEHAAASHNIYHLATQPAITEQLKELLGPDIILWGACCLDRVPGQIHPWHTDIESSRPEGGFVTVWIGLEGTNQASALKLVPGSHLLGATVQQSIQEHGRTRDTTTDEDVEAWASELAGEKTEIVQPDIGNGDAIFFDGRLWHGSSNTNVETTRRAFIFQYAAGNVPVYIPDFQHLEWPFVLLDFPRPPCLQICGQADREINHLTDVPPRITQDFSELPSAVHHVDLTTQVDEGEIVKFNHLMRGNTANLSYMNAHYSVLQPGSRPHPPWMHVEEELKIILQGKAQLHYADGAGKVTAHEVSAGEFVYYPAFGQHTIYNSSDEPVVYLMFKWTAVRELQTKSPLKIQRGRVVPLGDLKGDGEPFQTQEVFSSPTHQLNLLHCHVSTLQPGGGYDAHCDDHDVAIIVFEGEVETLGETVKAGEMVWCSAGQPHGISNNSQSPARYLVFEFHGANSAGDLALFDKHRSRKPTRLLKKRSLGRIVKNIKRVVGLRQE